MATCLVKNFFTVRIFNELLSACVCVLRTLSFGFEGRMWDLIVLVPDHCKSFYFLHTYLTSVLRSILTIPLPLLIGQPNSLKQL